MQRTLSGYSFATRPVHTSSDTLQELSVKDRAGLVVLKVKNRRVSVLWLQDLTPGCPPVASISTSTGGAHGNETDYFSELGKRPRLLARYFMGNVSGLELKKLRHDVFLTIWTGYDGFAYSELVGRGPYLPTYLDLKGNRLVDSTQGYPEELARFYGQAKDALSEWVQEDRDWKVKSKQTFRRGFRSTGTYVYCIGKLMGERRQALALLERSVDRPTMRDFLKIVPQVDRVLAARRQRLSWPKLPYRHNDCENYERKRHRSR